MQKLIGCYQIELAQAALEAQLQGCLTDHEQGATTIVTHTQAKGQSGLGSLNGSNYSQDGVHVCVLGTPSWRENDLAHIQKHSGDAAALCNAYQRYGQRCLEFIAGPFACAIVDNTKNLQFYAIDRLGIHGLYYYSFANGRVIVSSDLISIKQFPQVSLDIDSQGIFNYLYFHMVPSPGSIYSGVAKLEPGQYLLVDAQGIKPTFYWNPQFVEDKSSSEAALAEKLHQLLESAVKRCNIDEHSGAFLSGGLDSSTVVGVYSKLHAKTRSFSIGFDAKGFDEIEFARISAKHFKSELIEYYVTPADVADAVQKIAAYYEEPFGNASAIPTYYCAKLAKQHGVTKLLAGDGGDELFAGNARYAQQKVFELYYLLPTFMRKALVEPLAAIVPFGDSIFPIRKLRSYIKQANIRLPHRLQSYNFLEREGIQSIFHEDFLSAIDSQAPGRALQVTYDRANSVDSLNKMLFLDWKYTLADNDLRKVNHMCHLAGVDVCYPMLDEDLVNFSCAVPAALKLNGVKLRYFYKQAMIKFLPQATLNKSKHGFGLPFGVWLKTDPALQALAFDNLSRVKSRGIFQPRFVDTLIQQHRDGHANYYGDMIWAVMMLELWLTAHQ